MELDAISSSERKSVIIEHYSSAQEMKKKRCYTVMVYGRRMLTTVTDKSEVVEEWISEERGKARAHPQAVRHYGFELEVDVNTQRIGTVQLCSFERCLVFQLDYQIPDRQLTPYLAQFIVDRTNRFLGINIISKIALLKQDFPFNLQVHIIEVAQNTPFIGDLKAAELDSMVMGVLQTDWNKLPLKLTAAQVHYACLDAFFNLHLIPVRIPTN